MGLFDKFKNTQDEPKNMEIFDDFLKMYPPAGDLAKPSKHIIKAAKHVGIPNELIEFWSVYGFGNYGDGIIKVIDPEDYTDSLYTWLGEVDFNRIPIMMTGFGNLFYYRKLDDGVYDISILDIHYRNIDVCTYTFEEFITTFITSEQIQKGILKKELFDEAQKRLGGLSKDEIYFFAPALVLGGGHNINYVEKGTADVHHQLLFQLGN